MTHFLPDFTSPYQHGKETGMIGLMLHVGPDEVNLQELAEWLLSYNVHLEDVTFRGGHFKWERPERRDEYNDRQQREAHYEAEMEASARRQYEKLKERFEPFDGALWVTEEEMEQIKRYAAVHELNVSEYLRKLAGLPYAPNIVTITPDEELL